MNAAIFCTFAALACGLLGCNARRDEPEQPPEPISCGGDSWFDAGGRRPESPSTLDAASLPAVSVGEDGLPQGARSDAGAANCAAPDELPLRLAFQEIPIAGADFVTDFVFVPETSEIFATSKDGIVHHLTLEGDETRLLGQFRLEVYDELDCGLLSLALDPDFATNHFMYLGFCTDIRTNGIYRVQMTGDPGSIPETLREIISVEAEPVSEANERPWHNVGAIDFSDDGVMWVAFGDKVRSKQAQDPTDPLGALLRIVPNREVDGSGYTPAPGNPFADGDGHPAVYAIGLRSPWRGGLDRLGRYFLGDVGSDHYEEVNLIDSAGQNLGWPKAEGPCADECDGLLDPVTSWSRSLDHPYVLDDPEPNAINARVVNVGVEYVDRGNDRYSGRLTNRIVYGDACVGWIRALSISGDRRVARDDYVGHLNHIAAWRQSEDGYLYAVTHGRCQTDKQHDSDAPSKLFRAVAERP